MKAWPCLGRFGEQGLYLSVGGAVGLGFAEAAGGGGSQVRGSSQQQVPGGRVAGSLGTGSLRPHEPWGSCNSRKRGQGCVREAASPQHCNQGQALCCCRHKAPISSGAVQAAAALCEPYPAAQTLPMATAGSQAPFGHGHTWGRVCSESEKSRKWQFKSSVQILLPSHSTGRYF